MSTRLQIPGPRYFLNLNEEQIRNKREEMRDKLHNLCITSEKLMDNDDTSLSTSIYQIIQQLQIMKEDYEDGILCLIQTHSQQIKKGIDKIFEGLETHVKLQENLITQYHQHVKKINESDNISSHSFYSSSKIADQCNSHDEKTFLKDENCLDQKDDVYEYIKTEGKIFNDVDDPGEDVKIEADFTGGADEDSGDDLIKMKHDSDEQFDDPSFTSINKYTDHHGLDISKTKKNESKVCEECGKSFKGVSAFKRHLSVHTGDKPFVCDQCGRSFRLKHFLKSHKERHLEGRSYSCSDCEKTFNCKESLYLHTKIHKGDLAYTCKFCNKTLISVGALKSHIRIHTGEKPFACDQCDKSFRENSTLTIHKRCHTGEKPYSCDQCDKAFRQKDALIKHLRIHSGEKPFSCDQCGKSFRQSGDLKTHKNIHSGEKLFSCTLCAMEFVHRKSLARHKKRHERGYNACDECDKVFSFNSELKSHKLTHTEVKADFCD